MQKAEKQHKQVQNQPAVRQDKGMALDSSRSERIAQLEATAEHSLQAGRLAQLAAMANKSSRMSAQRKTIKDIHNSPNLTAQRQQLDNLAGLTAQSAQAHAQSGAPIQLTGREGDEWDPGPGQGEQAPPTPRPGQGGQERPPPPETESLVQDGYSPRAGEARDETAQLMKAGEVSQLKVAQCAGASIKPNNTGLPDNLKSGIESLSGMSMDSVRVHYNSSQPAQLNALACAQGADIHVAPGQERHLPHEAWHVVQQAQGRVKPTTQMKGSVPVNDDAGLEREADVMGARAASVGVVQGAFAEKVSLNSLPSTVQRYKYQAGDVQTVTLLGGTSKKSKQFEICKYNSVTYNKGDSKQQGTGTSGADWAGWLKDNGTGHNATQLHVVNQEWGGCGGAKEGNIGPGSQRLNGKHKGPENMFKNLFNGGGKANYDMTYKCSFNYNGGLLNFDNQTITGDVSIEDPTIVAEIDASNGPGGVDDGFGEGWVVPANEGDGMTVKDGG